MTFNKVSCTTLKGVGSHMADLLARCGIYTIQDLLFYLPLRYQDRTRVTAIRDLRVGDQAVIIGKIAWIELKRGKRTSLYCGLQDATGEIRLRFFHFTAAQRTALAPGTQLHCYGEVKGWGGELEIIHPEYKRISTTAEHTVAETLTPIYPSTEGLQQKSFYQLTTQALDLLEKNPQSLPEYLPASVLMQLQLTDLYAALRYVHRPPPEADLHLLEEGVHPAQQRLAFEELLAQHLSLRRLRNQVQQHRSPPLLQQPANKLIEKFLQHLPFKLTQAQLRVVQDIQQDLVLEKPMLRLVQGDVGSGKTVVAAIALLQAVANSYQAVFMAPTELLAEQHFQTLSRWFKPLNINVVWHAGKVLGKARTAALMAIEQGEAQVIVGTHALFQKDVNFARLGLIIVDEQHRFGVEQRLALREKGAQADVYPHQLVMTATPIPRTLAMISYADLDQSIIDELPPGRTPITTVVIPNERRAEVITRVRAACQDKHQVYWVCTLIDVSEVLQCQAAEVTATELAQILPELKIGLVHGRLKSAEKESIMASFKAGDIDLLVATTVIEVGVDVPNANLMVIENPERLGLAQLHQLRGRVGRGSVVSYCVLLYQTPLSQLAKARLAVMRQTNDGFEIARRDLALRGPGEVLGTRQTGLVQFRIANLMRDQALLPAVQRAADIMVQEANASCDGLITRWLQHSDLYAKV